MPSQVLRINSIYRKLVKTGVSCSFWQFLVKLGVTIYRNRNVRVCFTVGGDYALSLSRWLLMGAVAGWSASPFMASHGLLMGACQVRSQQWGYTEIAHSACTHPRWILGGGSTGTVQAW